MCIYLFVLNCSDSFKDHKSAADDPNYSTSKFEDMSEDDVTRYIYIKFKDCYEGTHFWLRYGGTLSGHVKNGDRNYFSTTGDSPAC